MHKQSSVRELSNWDLGLAWSFRNTEIATSHFSPLTLMACTSPLSTFFNFKHEFRRIETSDRKTDFITFLFLCWNCSVNNSYQWKSLSVYYERRRKVLTRPRTIPNRGLPTSKKTLLQCFISYRQSKTFLENRKPVRRTKRSPSYVVRLRFLDCLVGA